MAAHHIAMTAMKVVGYSLASAVAAVVAVSAGTVGSLIYTNNRMICDLKSIAKAGRTLEDAALHGVCVSAASDVQWDDVMRNPAVMRDLTANIFNDCKPLESAARGGLHFTVIAGQPLKVEVVNAVTGDNCDGAVSVTYKRVWIDLEIAKKPGATKRHTCYPRLKL